MDILKALNDVKIANDDARARATHGLGPDYDYSLFKGKAASNGHLGDIGKLPWHPTFSDESAYASKKYPGGHWGTDTSGNTTYAPSLQMLQDGRAKGLSRYMEQVEPDVKLVPPFLISSTYLKKHTR